MIPMVISTFVDLFVLVFNVILIARVVMSYFVNQANGFYLMTVNLTEPLLVPVRRLLPQTPGLDLAPLVTFFLLQGLQYLVHLLIGA